MSANTPEKSKVSELMEFPCEYSLKTFGLNSPGFEKIVIDIISAHCPESTTFNVNKNESKKGKYQSLTINFNAQSRQQMDDIYQSLFDSKEVVMSI